MFFYPAGIRERRAKCWIWGWTCRARDFKKPFVMFLIYVHISDDISYFMALTFESSKRVTAIHTRYKTKKKKQNKRKHSR